MDAGSDITFVGTEKKTYVINPTVNINLDLADSSNYRNGHEHYVFNRTQNSSDISIRDSTTRVISTIGVGQGAHVLLADPADNRWISDRLNFSDAADRSNVETAAAHFLGGIDVDVNLEYNPVKNTWETGHTNMPNPHTRGSGFAIGDTVKSGYVHGDDATPINLTELQTLPGTFATHSTPGNRQFSHAGGSIGVYGFSFGGIDTGSSVVDNLDRWNGSTDTWDVPSTGAMPNARCLQTGISDGSYVYSISGSSTTGFAGGVRETLRYDDSGTGTWTTQRMSPYQARIAASGFHDNGVLYVAFGRDPSGARLTDLDLYTPATNTWSMPPGAEFPGSARYRAGVCVLESVAYFAGGDISPTSPTHSDETWAYYPSIGVWKNEDQDMPAETGDWNGQCNSIKK